MYVCMYVYVYVYVYVYGDEHKFWYGSFRGDPYYGSGVFT